ncbi:MAG TPA: RNA 2',3'-cyclic phosphodiesterase [Geobacteraceae bacterium]
MYRLFVAIDLPQETKESVRAICHGLPEARWVPQEQLHLTLRFIGDADSRLFAAIKACLLEVKGESFSLTLAGIGHFPPGKRARVLWVGMERCETLLKLAQDVECALVSAGLPREERPFSPHITLARFRESPAGGIAPFEERHREFALPPFPVNVFHLYSSVLTPKGAVHTREASYPLAE